MADDEPAIVEVVYALPERQWIESVTLTEGMTALDAVHQSGLTVEHAEINDHPLVLGLFGVEIEPGYRVKPGDRIEICRPLLQDPREMRRHFIQAGRVMGQGDDESSVVEERAGDSKGEG